MVGSMVGGVGGGVVFVLGVGVGYGVGVVISVSWQSGCDRTEFQSKRDGGSVCFCPLLLMSPLRKHSRV